MKEKCMLLGEVTYYSTSMTRVSLVGPADMRLSGLL